ncbi:hypothetical protein [Polymorphospora rubra]|uniref:hypothetical protein n=1 Tax=Polymorphospora rubra TaxID=338584 RepID=UPI0033E85FCB
MTTSPPDPTPAPRAKTPPTPDRPVPERPGPAVTGDRPPVRRTLRREPGLRRRRI